MDLSAKQHRAVELILCGSSLQKVADAIGVRRETLWRWRRSPEFRAQLEAERAHRLREACARLEQLIPTAVAALEDLMVNPVHPASVRLSAARDLLDRAGVRTDAIASFRNTERPGYDLSKLSVVELHRFRELAIKCSV